MFHLRRCNLLVFLAEVTGLEFLHYIEHGLCCKLRSQALYVKYARHVTRVDAIDIFLPFEVDGSVARI